jgi:hypothetical protein
MGFEHFMAVNTQVMAYFQGDGVGKTDPGRLPPPEAPGIDEQGEEGIAGQFHEPVVTGRGGEKAAEAEVTLVIPFKTAVTAEEKQQDNGHYLA